MELVTQLEERFNMLLNKINELKEENQRLKRLVADLSLDKEMLQDVIRRKL